MKMRSIDIEIRSGKLIPCTEYAYDLDNDGEICGGIITIVLRQNTDEFKYTGIIDEYTYAFGEMAIS